MKMVQDIKSRLLSVSIFMSQLGIFLLLHLVKYDSEFILVNTTTFNIYYKPNFGRAEWAQSVKTRRYAYAYRLQRLQTLFRP